MTDYNNSLIEYIIFNIIIVFLSFIARLFGIDLIVGCILLSTLFLILMVRTKFSFVMLSVLIMLISYSIAALKLDFKLLILVTPAGLIMGNAYKKRRGALWISACGVLGNVISIVILNIGGNNNFYEMLSMLKDDFQLYIRTIPNFQNLGVDLQQQMYELVFSIVPASIITILFAVSFVVFALARMFLSIKDKKYNYFLKFYQLKADKFTVLVYIILSLFSFVISGTTGQIMLNIFILISIYLALCGLALAHFYLNKIGYKSLRVLFKFISFNLLFIPMILYVLIAIGIFDAWRNIRNLDKESEV